MNGGYFREHAPWRWWHWGGGCCQCTFQILLQHLLEKVSAHIYKVGKRNSSVNNHGRLTHVIDGEEQMGCFCLRDKLNGRNFHGVLQPLWDTVQGWRTPHGEAPRVTHTQEPAIWWARQARRAARNLEKAKAMKVTQTEGLQASKKVTFTSRWYCY